MNGDICSGLWRVHGNLLRIIITIFLPLSLPLSTYVNLDKSLGPRASVFIFKMGVLDQMIISVKEFKILASPHFFFFLKALCRAKLYLSHLEKCPSPSLGAADRAGRRQKTIAFFT